MVAAVAAAHAGGMSEERSSLIRRNVRDVLEASPSYRALSEAQRREVARDMATVSDRLVAEQGRLVEEVDFPAFVAGLIRGTFNAIVDSSIQQMQAYAELVKSVAEGVDASVAVDCHPHCRDPIDTRLRMGINRIVVTDGTIKAK